ncbi:MAG: hypothetical protein ACRYFS_11980 [Janthinobacterium lividum]
MKVTSDPQNSLLSHDKIIKFFKQSQYFHKSLLTMMVGALS